MESIYGRPKVNFRVVSKFVESSWNMELTEARGHDTQSWKRYVTLSTLLPSTVIERSTSFDGIFTADIYSTPVHRFPCFSALQQLHIFRVCSIMPRKPNLRFSVVRYRLMRTSFVSVSNSEYHISIIQSHFFLSFWHSRIKSSRWLEFRLP